MFGQRQGQLSRGYIQDIDGGPPRPFTPEGVGGRSVRWWSMPVSPDGTRVIGMASDGQVTIFHVSDGTSSPVKGLRGDEFVVQWLKDGNVLVTRAGRLPWIVERLNVSTGQRATALEIGPRETAGLRLRVLAIATDGRHFVHSYSRLLSDLFLVEGLK